MPTTSTIPPKRNKNTNPKIDLGLAVLDSVNRDPENPFVRPATFTHRGIAEICGCHPRAIQQIEKRALEKLRQRICELGLKEDVIDLLKTGF